MTTDPKTNTVSHLAGLSNLELGGEELRRLRDEFENIVTFVGALEAAGAGDVTPTGQVTELENVFQPDAVEVFSHPRTLIEQASRQDDFFLVPPPLHGE